MKGGKSSFHFYLPDFLFYNFSFLKLVDDYQLLIFSKVVNWYKSCFDLTTKTIPIEIYPVDRKNRRTVSTQWGAKGDK
jgi:hypothetical protein